MNKTAYLKMMGLSKYAALPVVKYSDALRQLAKSLRNYSALRRFAVRGG